MSSEITSTPAPAGETEHRPASAAFIAMLALVFAVVAFSIDSMLPSLPRIAAELVPQNANRAQLVLTTFMVGLGLGTLFAGPIADAVGRKPVVTGGFALYIAGAVLAIFARSIEMLLLARLVQGLGASGPRIAITALIRDLYSGREMARLMSIVQTLFMLVPAVAPSMGQVIVGVWGWRGVFGAFILFGVTAALWVGLAQDETLPPARRRPLHLATLAAAAREALSDRNVALCTIVLTLGFGQMFALLSSSQQLFVETYGRGERFPLWFAGLAGLALIGTVANARLVVRVGMRRMAAFAYAAQVVLSAVFLILLVGGLLPPGLAFPVFYVWAVGLFMMAGVTFGNLNAMALSGMGHIAGTTASLVAALSTVGAMLIGAPVGQLYDGTAVPVVTAALICSALAWLLLRRVSADAG